MASAKQWLLSHSLGGSGECVNFPWRAFRMEEGAVVCIKTYSQTKTIFLQCESWGDLITDYVLDLLTRGTLCTEVGTCTTGIMYSAGLKNYLLTNNWDTSSRWQLWNWTVIKEKKILLTKQQAMWDWTAQRNCSVLLNNQRGTEIVSFISTDLWMG